MMFTIGTLSGIQGIIGASISTTVVRQSGGYDLIGQARTPIANASQIVAGNATVASNVSEMWGLSAARTQVTLNASMSGDLHNTTLLGVPQDWVNASIPLGFQYLDPNYSTPQAAWQALETDPHLAIADGSVVPGGVAAGFGGGGFFTFSANVGDTLYYGNATNQAGSLKLIGILYEQFVPGLFVGWNTVQSAYHVDAASIFYIKVASGADATAVGHDLERAFLPYGLVALDINNFVSQITDVITGVFNLLEAYLALGLIVGIAGQGVITMRNVVERRPETGALRALGFRKTMILASFLLELMFIAVTGIAIGDALGIALSYDLFLKFFADVGYFTIPWDRLILLSSIAFVGAVLATASPAIRAARLPPAEARRSYE